MDATRKLRYEEFLDFVPEDETLWYELVDGELVVTPWPALRHQVIFARLLRELQRLGDDAGHGLTFFHMGFRVGPASARIPDLVFIANDKLPLPAESKDLPVVPDLIVEILSPSTAATDLRDKRDEYRAAGVPAYWIVDPEARSVTVWDFTAESPTAVEYRGRLPCFLRGRLVGEIDLEFVFRE